MPSERRTPPTTIRIRITDAGAVVVTSLRSELMEFILPNVLRLWGRRRGKLRDISQSETSLDGADLFHCIFKTVLTKLLMLDVLKLVVHFVELFAGHRLFPRGEDNCVFSRSMIAIHQHESFQRLRQCFSVTCP